VITDVEALERASGLNRFSIVVAVTKRANNLERGAPPAVRATYDAKPVSIACAEILANERGRR